MGQESTSTTADASQRPRLNRSRWAAIGAAVAVSLGAGGFGLANATVSTGEQPVYIAIDPCRLSDTRPAFPVNTRLTPYGPNETVTWTGTGAQGNCNVPLGVSALALNVTALDATLPTYLQFAPGTTVTPGGASSLNPVPGQPPTPNAVTISIDDDGKFSIYNLQGTVNVIIDVVGYFDDHEHTGADIVDESLTGADVEDGSLTGADVEDGSLTGADVEDGSLTGADVEDLTIEGVDIKNNTVGSEKTSNEPGVVSAYKTANTTINSSADTVVQTIAFRAPSDGYMIVSASINFTGNTAGTDVARCQFTKGTAYDPTKPNFRLNEITNASNTWFISTSSELSLDVKVADNPLILTAGQTIKLVCDQGAGSVDIEEVYMQGLFVASSYAPTGFLLLCPPFCIFDPPADPDSPAQPDLVATED